jgi:hypothetical protein
MCNAKKEVFASFWMGGALSPYEAACLSSFVSRGYEVELYSYSPVTGLPQGVIQRDGREILPEAAVDWFKINGRRSLSHFSDLFRYMLFFRIGSVWIDTDMLMLRPITIPLDGNVFARENLSSICGAIMRIDPAHKNLPGLIEAAEKFQNQPMRWGETGPRLLTKSLGSEVMTIAHPPEMFFPISYDMFWMAFLPECCEPCEELCQSASTVHLWNNIVERLGIWKQIGPPAGSFLHKCFKNDNSLDRFAELYPASVMQNMIENWRLRKSGGDLGVKQIAKRFFPSIARTVRHHSGISLS